MRKSPTRAAYDKLATLYPLGARSILCELRGYLNENDPLAWRDRALPPRAEQLMMLYLGFLYRSTCSRLPTLENESSFPESEKEVWLDASRRIQMDCRTNNLTLDAASKQEIGNRHSPAPSVGAPPHFRGGLRKGPVSRTRAYLGEENNINIYISILKGEKKNEEAFNKESDDE